MTAFFKRRT